MFFFLLLNVHPIKHMTYWCFFLSQTIFLCSPFKKYLFPSFHQVNFPLFCSSFVSFVLLSTRCQKIFVSIVSPPPLNFPQFHVCLSAICLPIFVFIISRIKFSSVCLYLSTRCRKVFVSISYLFSIICSSFPPLNFH